MVNFKSTILCPLKTFLTDLCMMALNIGEKIRLRAKQLRIGPTELGKLINTSKQNIYSLYKRKSVDAETLRKLSAALEYDFFEYYRLNDETSKLIEAEQKYERLHQKVVPLRDYQKLKSDFDNLKEKYELLKKINSLLEKKQS
jgi:transcriptional regulator with XRE-family HTH domain